MERVRTLRTAAALVTALATATVGAAAGPASAHGHGHGDDEGGFRQVNLVSDLPGLAKVLDAKVKNPWGIAFGPATPLWVNNQNGSSITVYRGATAADFIKLPLEVSASSPTGIVFNPTTSFKISQGGTRGPSNFLFTENVFGSSGPTGEVTAWRNTSPAPLPLTTVVKARRPGNFYAGLALVPMSRRGPLLLAAGNRIEVYDSHFRRITRKDDFVDPHPVAGMAPYNVMYLHGMVYVAYADLLTFGPGGAVDVFTANGRFVRRLVTGSPLNGAWGMAIAPEDWGRFGGALLVGNVGDGMINAFSLRSGRRLGAVSDGHGHPIVNPGLWGIEFGNGVIGTPNTLVFAAGVGSEVGGGGPDVYEHGLVGFITPRDDD